MYIIFQFLFFFSYLNTLRANEELTHHQISLPSLTREKIQLIEPKDRLILEDFFRNLFQDNAFAYTLFGPKPMGFNRRSWNFVDTSSSKGMQVRILIDFIGWQTWQKYASLFPSQNFCLKKDQPLDPTDLGFTIINKQRCREVIAQYLPSFQACFDQQKTVQEIFDIICHHDFFEFYGDKKGFISCLGLLLGYGEKNSQACEKINYLLIQTLYQAPYHLKGLTEKMKNRQGYFHMGLQQKSSVEGLEQPLTIQPIIEELNELNKAYKPITLVHKEYLCPIRDFRCAGFIDDPETQALQVQYESIYQKLVDIYNAENFLEIVLTQLSS